MDKILVVDDDKYTLEIIEDYLSAKGYEVKSALNGTDALRILDAYKPDCIVLDINLPDISGYEICEKIKKKINTPIIFLSGLAEEKERVRGFLIGGDDYVTKPYSIEELELRIKLRIRSNNEGNTEEFIIKIDDLTIDLEQRIVHIGDGFVELTSKEFDILVYMVRNPGKVFSKEEIFQEVWDQSDNGDVRTVQVHVSNLRDKINKYYGNTSLIKTKWGKGYCFDRRSIL